MRIGISEQYTGDDGRDGRWMLESARLIEELGFDSLWVPERQMFFPSYDSAHPYAADEEVTALRWLFEGFASLAAIAVATERLRLGTYVAIVAVRDPIVTARDVATVDQISNGRFTFGVGSGWMKEEFDAYGVDWRTRGARTTEYLLAMKAIWTTHVSEFYGRFVDLPPSYVGPKPVQQPHPPIAIGGNSEAAIRRIVAVGDRWLGYNLPPDEIGRFVERLHRALTDAGRDPDGVGLATGTRIPGVFGPARSREVDPAAWETTRTYIEACERLGLEEVVVSTRMPVDGYERHMREFAETIGVEPANPRK